MKNSSITMLQYALAPSPRRPIQFNFRTGVRGVGIDQDRIYGHWNKHFNTLRVERRPEVLLEFANLVPDAKGIAHFTKAYGPIDRPFESDSEFQFGCDKWLEAQKEFRKDWEALMPARAGEVARIPRKTLAVRSDESFQFAFGEMTYHAATLRRLLLLELCVIQSTRLWVCENPDCVTPYFLAARKSQVFCSPECAEWGQREAKRKWWAKEGGDQRRRKCSRDSI